MIFLSLRIMFTSDECVPVKGKGVLKHVHTFILITPIQVIKAYKTIILWQTGQNIIAIFFLSYSCQLYALFSKMVGFHFFASLIFYYFAIIWYSLITDSFLDQSNIRGTLMQFGYFLGNFEKYSSQVSSDLKQCTLWQCISHL